MVDDFRGRGVSPWGSPPGGGGNGSGRKGPTPPDVDEIIRSNQDKINKFMPGGAPKGGKPIIFGLVIATVLAKLKPSLSAVKSNISSAYLSPLIAASEIDLLVITSRSARLLFEDLSRNSFAVLTIPVAETYVSRQPFLPQPHNRPFFSTVV